VFHEQAREASALKRPVSAAIKVRIGQQHFTAFIVSFREDPVVVEMEHLMVDAISSLKVSIWLQGGRVMAEGPTQAIRPIRTQSSMVLLFPYKQANRLKRHEEAAKVVYNPQLVGIIRNKVGFLFPTSWQDVFAIRMPRIGLISRASAALDCVGVWSHVVALAIPIKLHNTHATRVYPCSQRCHV
jgi:hypothetical protein